MPYPVQLMLTARARRSRVRCFIETADAGLLLRNSEHAVQCPWTLASNFKGLCHCTTAHIVQRRH